MVRPRLDGSLIRNEILEAAEKLLAETGGRRLVLSDIASHIGKSQSYIHTHFRTKQHLIGALAERWFSEVEAAATGANETGTPEQRARAQIIAVLTTKRVKFESDPTLFGAYLTLAAAHRKIVAAHVSFLTATLRSALVDIVGEARADEATTLMEDATVQFRVPHMIALKPHRATPYAANAVIDLVMIELRSWRNEA